MSFDEQPDPDPHGECAAEIATKNARIKELESELAAARRETAEKVRDACRIRCVNELLSPEILDDQDISYNHGVTSCLDAIDRIDISPFIGDKES